MQPISLPRRTEQPSAKENQQPVMLTTRVLAHAINYAIHFFANETEQLSAEKNQTTSLMWQPEFSSHVFFFNDVTHLFAKENKTSNPL